jgi:hypothetical protein
MSRKQKLVFVAVFSIAVVCFNLLEPSLAMAGEPPYTPGEQQISMGITRFFTYAIEVGGPIQKLAQTFTPISNQWLGFLLIPVGCTQGAGLDVKITKGLGGTPLYQSVHMGLPDFVDGTYQLLQVFDPSKFVHGIKLQKGVVYAFELSVINGTCGIIPGPVTDSYSGGQAYFSDADGPFIPLPAGGETDSEDLPFSTLVR